MSGKAAAPGAGKHGKKRSLKTAGGESGAVIDELFASIPKRAAREPPVAPAEAPASKPKARGGAAAAGKAAADGERKPESRRRQQDYYLDTGEKLVPVSAPRRIQDGLPIFKSFEGFSDFATQGPKEKTGKPGKCPFDCWCCY